MFGDQRYLHVLTHSFPTRPSADLAGMMEGGFQTQAEVGEEGGELGYRRHDPAPAGGAEREAPDPAVVLCDLADEGADVHQAALAGAERVGFSGFRKIGRAHV